jgi:hypothetical protein
MAAELNDDAATPQRTTMESVVSVEQTPGQRIAQQQAEVFTEARFLEVFEEEGFNALLRILDSDTIKGRQSFNTLSDVSVPYDELRKRTLIRKINQFMDVRARTRIDTNFQNLYGKVLMIARAIYTVNTERIEELSMRYFQDKCPGSRVTCSSKMAGDQLGTVVKVQTADGRTFKYFVKTHSGGLRSGYSSAAKLVNPAELLVYKVLEGLGVGCETHFFGRDGHNLYIATLDAGVQTNPDGFFTQGPFHEYSHFKDSRESGVQRSLWGDLTHLPTDVEFSDDQHRQAEAWIASDLVAKNFVREAAKLDLLARIMGLEDFQTNPGNYGFTQAEGGLMKAKAIDFRVPYKKVEEFEKDYRSFNAFLNGNGEFNYSSTGAAMYYALTKRQQRLRVYEAKDIMQNTLSEFIEKVDSARISVAQVLRGIAMSEGDQNGIQLTLARYADILKANFQLFKTMLDEWRPVTTRAE